MDLAATFLLLADGRGGDPSGIGGVLVIIGVIAAFAALFGGVLWYRARRARRGESHPGPDRGEHPPRNVGRTRGSG